MLATFNETLRMVGGSVLGLASLYAAAIALRLHNEWQLRQRTKGRLVLTFDDGPCPTATQAVRALLRREAVKGTFFISGMRGEEHTHLIEDALAEGHDIGSHAFFHVHGWRRPLGSLADVLRGLQSLKRLHPKARFFRPPFGKATLLTHMVCWWLGFRMAYWTLDCKDAEPEIMRSPQAVVDEFLRQGGGVVLLHDLDMDPQRYPQRIDQVLAICEALIACAKSKGMPISTLSDISST